jgi:purine catabolism regulator
MPEIIRAYTFNMTTRQDSGIPLSEVLKTGSFKGSKILTGKEGLDRIVTGVTVGEVPDIANWLTGGELVLSTLFAVSRDPEAIRWFAKKVINSPAVALAIKPARFLDVLPNDILELAASLEFPVVEVPPDVRWTTITAEIYEMLVKNKSKHSNINTDNELLRVAIDGRGLGSIARAAAKKLYAPVYVYDYLDGIVAQSSSKSADSVVSQGNMTFAINKENIAGIVDKFAAAETDSFNGANGAAHDVKHVTLDEYDIYATHVMIGWEKVAMVLTATPFDLDKISLDVLRKTAEAVAIEISRTRAIEEAEARAYGDFLSDVIAGRIPLNQVENRLTKLGIDLSGGFTIVECDFEAGSISGRFYREALRLIKGESKNSLIIEHEGSLVILLAYADDETKPDHVSHSRRLSKKVLDIAGSLQINMNIGVSRLKANANEILKALDEAKVALDFGRRMEGAGAVTKFDEVGIYRLLLPLARESSEEGRQFYNETIGCLVAYDKRHGTNLVETLECFRRNNENIALTAEELFAHRHTIRYRLQRVSEITGSDPFTGTERDRLYMGLYVKHLLNL